MQSISTPIRLSGISAIAAAALFLAAPATQAAVVIFDDADVSGWSRAWYTPTQTTHVYEGTTALQTSNGQFQFEHEGFVNSNHILEFYVNTKDSTLASGLRVILSWVAADGTVQNQIPYDNRNIPVTYVIDDTPVTLEAAGFALDTDPGTWQKVQLDLTQTAYTGWPYESHTYVPGVDTLTRINFRAADGFQADNVIMDNVRLVPEPASFSLLGLAAGGLLRRRRR